MHSVENNVKSSYRAALSLIAAALVASFTLTSTPAEAKPPSLDGLPQKSEMLLGIDVAQSRGTPVFDKMVAMLEKDSDGKRVLDTIEKQAGIDITKDIDYIVMSFPNAQATSQGQQTSMAAVVTGRFDRKKIEKLLSEQKEKKKLTTSKKGKHVVYTTTGEKPQMAFGFVDKGRVLVAIGDDAFRGAAWKSASSKKSASVTKNKTMKKLMGQVDTRRNMWLVADTSSMSPTQVPEDPKEAAEIQQAKAEVAKAKGAVPEKVEKKAGQNIKMISTKMNSVLISLDINKGLNMDALAHLSNEKGARSIGESLEMDIEKNKKNPMFMMLGAAPLLQKMKVGNTGKKLEVTTSMTAKELATLMTMLEQMNGGGGTPARPPQKK
jgi:predicted lactoylglutathione lyase/ferritin-like protein